MTEQTAPSPPPATAGAAPDAFAGGGEMGALIRGFDWSASLGPTDAWPQSLKTATALLLHSPVPIVMLWGEDGIMIYNDAYSVFAGRRHPQLLGSKVREGWPEVADFNDNVMKVGLAGGTLAYRDQELTLDRRGQLEKGWMDLDYSPVIDESGRPAGVVAIVVETTERVLADRKLRESEERFQFAIQAADAATWDWDVSANRVYTDAAFARLYSVDPARARDGAPIGAFIDGIHPDDRERVGAEIEKVLAHPGEFHSEYRLRLADGSVRWVLARGRVYPNEEGAAVRFPGVVVDITERRRTEALRAMQNRVLELAIRDASLSETLTDLVRAVEMHAAAPSMASVLLMDEDGAHLRHGAAPSLPDAYNEAIDGIATGYGVGSCGTAAATAQQVVVTDIAADPLWADFRDLALSHGLRACWSTPILSPQGKVLGTFAIYYPEPREPTAEDREMVDFVARSASLVIERKQAETALRHSEDRLRLAVDATRIGIWDYDLAANRLEWDDQVRAAFGLDGARHVDYDLFLEGLHPDDRERTDAAVRAALEPGSDGAYATEYRTIGLDDGIERWIAARGRTVFVGGGAVRFIGTTLDISGPKAQSEELRHLNETLEQRVADEVAHRAEAEEALRQAQKMETLGQLTGGVAHDFNNLLQIVSGNLELIQRNLPGDAPRLQRAAANAARGADRAAVLTQRLLAFSRRQPLAPKPIEPNRLVSGMSELLHRTLGETVAVETVLGSGLWMVEADPNQLENAILNLAVNGRDAMRDGGKLTIETCNAHLDRAYAAQNGEVQAGQYICICVSDTGSGMDADTATRAFEPFFTTKDVGKGTGLGLSMVYGFVKQSGGHLKIYSEIGEGTTVKIYLPRLAHGRAVVEEAAQPQALEVGQNETILVCEDDDEVRAFTVEVLRDLGYRVLEAADGPAALRQLQRQDETIDLLFTDVVLPSGMTGAMVAREAHRLRPDLKILFTTGYARNAIVHHGRLDAGVELITKPFSYTDLAARVRDMLDGAG